ncbi:phage baseplate plug family protein [Metabacillus litoralis]|uniref:phage baseplate plug family protein n=1 Tax=Metabacillus litoralis TaxID=152268 RepID=UPI00203D04A0|nr:hypothetical protein [Metabacillus litoralis]MCM3413517.1 hypothetical protein [Metabacillus litoralis]
MIIEIQKDEIPYTFEVEIDGELFGFQFNYNVRFDFFTIDLKKNDEVIVYGEKLVLGQPLFTNNFDAEVPNAVITPLDLNGTETRVTYENLGETVFLFVEVIE